MPLRSGSCLGNEITRSSDLPQDGARGCAFHDGNLYVDDAQNARFVRLDGAHDGSDLEAIALEDTLAEPVHARQRREREPARDHAGSRAFARDVRAVPAQ
jgi:hypothetical protein